MEVSEEPQISADVSTGKCYLHPLNRRLGQSQKRSGHFGEEKTSYPCWELKGLSGRELFIVPTVKEWLTSNRLMQHQKMHYSIIYFFTYITEWGICWCYITLILIKCTKEAT